MNNLNRNKQGSNPSEATTMADLITLIRGQKIPHQEILRASQEIANLPQSLAETYYQKVLIQKTRTIRLLGKKSSAEIIHTLLGYEVKAIHKRLHCPDLVTAQYLRIFTELGCHSIKLPYDPTITAKLLPEFECVIESIAKSIRALFPGDLRLQHYVARKIYAIIRRQLRAVQKTYNALTQKNEQLSE